MVNFTEKQSESIKVHCIWTAISATIINRVNSMKYETLDMKEINYMHKVVCQEKQLKYKDNIRLVFEAFKQSGVIRSGICFGGG